jgi:citrate synthase
VASGLLGAGNVFLGVVDDTARFLAAILADPTEGAVGRAVQAEIDAGRRIPGLGHPVHKVEDPRTPRLYGIAEEAGIPIPHLTVLRTVAEVHAATTGKALPINGAGVAGAAFADLGLPPAIIRGFALLARTAGLVGHLAEEMEHPIGRRLWLDVEHRATSET